MEQNKSLAISMQQTIEYGNFNIVGDIGEIVIDATLEDGILKDIPIIGTIVGVGKCINNVHDFLFAKKLIAFLVPIKDVPSKERIEAIKKWEEDKNYRGKVGDTLLGMVERCDNTKKATWLSKLFYELVLKRNYSRLFMRSEKTLSSLSVMDLQAFLDIPKEQYYYINQKDSEPYIGSGLYQNPKPIDSNLNIDDMYCEPTEIGIWIYHVLNDIPITEEKCSPLF
jgi:hypothetical protein